jgi:hypothetical protein
MRSILILFFVISPISIVQPQSFGFGCLGLVGGYGGFTYQQYQPGLLKDYVNEFNLLKTKPLDDFGKADGYRFGINFFRAKFSGFFVTAKGFYQQLEESHDAQKFNRGGFEDFNYELKFKSFGVGLDIGIPIYSRLLWKIVDGAVLVNTARMTETVNNFMGTNVRKFDNEKTEVGYSVGSGFVLDILKNYVSIEGIVGYSFFQIGGMISEDKTKFENLLSNPEDNKPFIKSGGFNAAVQLNVGFPL